MVDKDGEMAWFTDKVDTCATDDKFLYVNPEFYFKLTLDEQLFINCHEIGHAMFGHAALNYMLALQGHIDYSDGVRLPVINITDPQGNEHSLLNMAEDYVINDQLVTAKIGKMPEGGLHWPQEITGDMSVLDSYRKLYEQVKKNGSKQCMRTTGDRGQDMGPGSGKPSAPTLQPGKGQGKTPNKAMSERSQSEWDTSIQAAMESAKIRGQLPANLERLFGKRLTPKADWRDLYLLAMSKRIGNDRYTWDRLEQQLAYRKIGSPGRTSFGCNLVVIAVDTSGSINQRTLDVFLAETMAFMEQAKPRRIIFCQCDAEINEWVEIDGADDLYGRKLKGGGGSASEPVFDRIKKDGEEPDLIVYLSDGYLSFGPKPDFPVIWGLTEDVTPPWGEIVRVPAQHEEA